jgi:alcohol dehydrogenase
MLTRAAVLRRCGTGDDGTPPPFESLGIEEVELAGPGPGEVEVAPATACICHSDLSVLTGDRPRPVPMVLGHEASGVVTGTGPGVTRFEPGQRVVFSFVPSCGHCRFCASGRPALCEPGNAANKEGRLLCGAQPFQDGEGAPLNQHLGLSAFSERTVVAQESLLPVPPDIPLELAALFGCGIVTGVGAVVNTVQVRPGASVGVFGLGGVGLSAIMGARIVGATTIVAVDVVPDKFELARELGATTTLTAGEDVASDVIEATGGGVDYAFDATGSAAVLSQAYAATRRGGTAVIVGLPDPAARVPVSPADLVASERTLCGSYMGSAVPARDLPWLFEAHRAGRLPVERLVGERLELSDVPGAFERLHEGAVVGRQLVTIAEAA